MNSREILQWLVKEIEPQRIPGRLQIELVNKIDGLLASKTEELPHVWSKEDLEMINESREKDFKRKIDYAMAEQIKLNNPRHFVKDYVGFDRDDYVSKDELESRLTKLQEQNRVMRLALEKITRLRLHNSDANDDVAKVARQALLAQAQASGDRG